MFAVLTASEVMVENPVGWLPLLAIIGIGNIIYKYSFPQEKKIRLKSSAI